LVGTPSLFLSWKIFSPNPRALLLRKTPKNLVFGGFLFWFFPSPKTPFFFWSMCLRVFLGFFFFTPFFHASNFPISPWFVFLVGEFFWFFKMLRVFSFPLYSPLGWFFGQSKFFLVLGSGVSRLLAYNTFFWWWGGWAFFLLFPKIFSQLVFWWGPTKQWVGGGQNFEFSPLFLVWVGGVKPFLDPVFVV